MRNWNNLSCAQENNFVDWIGLKCQIKFNAFIYVRQ